MAMYRLLNRSGTFYSVEIATRKRKTLRAKDPEHAQRLIDALKTGGMVRDP